MQPSVRYGAVLVRQVPKQREGLGWTIATGGGSQHAKAWTCEVGKAVLARTAPRTRDFRTLRTHRNERVVRAFSTSLFRRNESDPTRQALDPASPHDPPKTPATQLPTLPSRIAARRHHLNRRLSLLRDRLLSTASLASQQINTDTGTDFSGIEALRAEIVTKEVSVKRCHAIVNERKDAHIAAHAKQASSQKEIVGLLERKSSWGPSDLERYMSLVRSEHLDEQAVQTAKSELAEAERELEEARGLLERLERNQYHEEQIWSDTIRRNSTWVTMGLMGVNILLLLAQILLFEPYRRRRIVREVKEALDEKSISHVVPVVAVQEESVPAEVLGPVPAAVALREASAADPVVVVPVPTGELSTSPETPALSSMPAAAAVTASPAALLPQPIAEPGSFEQSIEQYRESFLDLFSERLIELRKVDVTTVALQGAASGVAVMGFLFLLLRPK
nr:hypothetical protein B0A51_06811 [Rachicladosporium sp. CCFEE 5018]